MSTETVALRLGASPEVARALEDCCIRFSIRSTIEKAHFLGQMAQESRNYSHVRENMRYSAKRLAEVWPNRYATESTRRLPVAQRLPTEKARALAAGGEEAIANDVYGGRMGNNQPGDGFRFIGRGYKMLTGRSNYTAFSLAAHGDLRAVSEPARLERLPDAVLSGGWFWTVNRIGQHAENGDVLTVSRAVNLGNANSTATPNGLAERRAATARALALFAELRQ